MSNSDDTPQSRTKSQRPPWLWAVRLTLPRDDCWRIAVVLRATGREDDAELADLVQWYADEEAFSGVNAEREKPPSGS